MHPLDEKYWRKRENWRWWGYVCPDDPRVIVSKRPRWTGYTINFAHRRALPVLLGIIALILLPVPVCIAVRPQADFLVLGVVGIMLVLTIALCRKAANPKTWKGG